VSDGRATALEGRAEAVAKGWLIALLERTPLPAVEQLSTHVFAHEGPELCAALARALASDDELGALAREPGLSALRAAADPAAAAEALRAVLWAALLATSPEPRADELAALADRLSHAVATLLSGVVEPNAASPPGVLSSSSPLSELERRLEEIGDAGGSAAVLVVEVDGVAALRAAGPAEQALAGALNAIRGEVLRGDLVVPDEDGRAWVLAAGAGRGAAEALAARIAAAVGALPPPHGAPLTVSAGIALQPEDTREVGSLLARAEESMLAARAAGVSILSAS
jgi:GGDEF domain-containing protein